MKMSRLSQRLVSIMPIVAVLASSAIVAQQSIRHDQLKAKLASYEKERSALEKRYNALRKASGLPVASDPDGGSHHHDDD